MRISTRLFALISLSLQLALPATSRAAWDSRTLALTAAFGREPVAFPDRMVGSLWGSARARYFDFVHPSYEVVSLASPSFAEGSLDTLISLRKNFFRPIRAPLMVFLPGLFNNPADSMSVRGLSLYAERGYHVLVIPNPWSEHYISRRPGFSPGSVQDEGRVVLEILESARKRIGEELISGVDIVGDSYGGFTAAVAFALDSRREHPMIDGNATIVGAPVSLKKSTWNLDRMVDRIDPLGVEKCQTNWSLARVMLDLFLSSRQDRLWAHTRECADTILIYSGFVDELQLTTQALLQARRIKPKEPGWPGKIRFSHFIRELTPENVAFFENGDHDLIQHWLSQIRPERRERIRILTARDDFLNDPADWTGHRELFEFNDRNLILLPWGGHLGFESLPWFQEFLKSAFKRD